MTAILAFSILVGPPAFLLGLTSENTSPSMMDVSSMVPPFFLESLIFLKSQLVSFEGSTIPITASTASGERIALLDETTFEEREVETQPMSC